MESSVNRQLKRQNKQEKRGYEILSMLFDKCQWKKEILAFEVKMALTLICNLCGCDEAKETFDEDEFPSSEQIWGMLGVKILRYPEACTFVGPQHDLSSVDRPK
ncbi:hypothetical protein RR48_10802 [Papilio machaon]|uniref:Uncharacterized protein n=1 Tax=Papilio machaon TaxID=76193 RepID=A0A194R724_PAPMA|nr:hypothetical protein RR48_10802 [Papilio machaon]